MSDLLIDISAVFQMFGMSKVVAERNSATKEVESSLPLKTAVSD